LYVKFAGAKIAFAAFSSVLQQPLRLAAFYARHSKPGLRSGTRVTFVAARPSGPTYAGFTQVPSVQTGASSMSTLPLPQISTERCTGCERCVDICPQQALVQSDGKAMLIYPERCTYCTLCEDICPTQAIALPFLIVFAGHRPQ